MDDSDATTFPEESSSSPGEGEVPALVGTIVADRYRVVRLLGEGAMGAVYRAQHIHMQKDVALKVLHQAMSANSEVVKRFEREAVAAGRIEHPNVAGATDFGRLADGSFYLVLEYIAGQSLGELMEEAGVMPPERAARIGAQIASALAAAHAMGIVHRDLKPENVMLPRGDHEGDIVKVLDFGMAKMQQESDAGETKLTMHGAVYGTPAYMAPEQAAGNEVDHRADLYAMGLILYEMLAGRQPFDADQVMALLIKHMTEKPPALPSTVPRVLNKLVMKLLEKDPGSRQQTADEVLAQLSDYLGIAFQDPRLSAVGLQSPSSGTPRPPQSSVAAVKEQVSDQLAKVGPLLDRAMVASEPAVHFLKQPMTVKDVTFPRWVPAAGVFGFLIVLFVLLLSGGDEPEAIVVKEAQAEDKSSSAPVDVAARDPAPPDPELAKVITAAEQGSDSALYALEQRSDDDRSLTEWIGLTQARLMRKQIGPALSAYKKAIAMDKSVEREARILGALCALAQQDEFAEPVLEFAAEELGATGADLLFHVWAKTSLKTKATTLAKKLLESGDVRDQYSPALAIAMSLRDAESCEDTLKLLPEVERVGDERTLTKLRAMHKKRGCGEHERSDCYPCLREGKLLQNATVAAGMRNANRFELKDWRWKK